jgi:hypothetical protein
MAVAKRAVLFQPLLKKAAEATENLSQKDRRVGRDMNLGRPHYENGIRWLVLAWIVGFRQEHRSLVFLFCE